MWIYILRTATADIFRDIKSGMQAIALLIGCFLAIACVAVWASSILVIFTGIPSSLHFLNTYPGTVAIVMPLVAFGIRLGIVMRKIRRSLC